MTQTDKQWGYAVSGFKLGRCCASKCSKLDYVNQITEEMTEAIRFYRDEKGCDNVLFKLFHLCPTCHGYPNGYPLQDDVECTTCNSTGMIITSTNVE